MMGSRRLVRVVDSWFHGIISLALAAIGHIPMGKICWLIWDLSCLRLIFYKIVPPSPDKEEKLPRPSSFLIWFVGIYVTLYGVALQRYDGRKAILENRLNIILSQMGSTVGRYALNSIPDLQSQTCPVEPDFINPFSVSMSFLGPLERNEEILESTKSVIENNKYQVDSLNLSGIDLSETNLTGADFQSATLEGALFSQARLAQANFRDSCLEGANFDGADLINLDGGISSANFIGANLKNSSFKGTLIESYKTFADASSLEGAVFDHEIHQDLRENCPKLFGSNNLE